jgi:hypothetical protein
LPGECCSGNCVPGASGGPSACATAE